jgi:ribosomal protein S8
LLEIESTDGRLRKNRSAKNIERNQIRQGHFVLNSITTSAGVINGFEAGAKKIGGVPLFRV